MYRIAFTPEAIDDLDSIRKYDAKRVIDEIEKQLTNEPTLETRNRKRLRPNKLAGWELRVGGFRVFYDIEQTNVVVRIVAVGNKVGSKLFIHGEEFDL